MFYNARRYRPVIPNTIWSHLVDLIIDEKISIFNCIKLTILLSSPKFPEQYISSILT